MTTPGRDIPARPTPETDPFACGLPRAVVLRLLKAHFSPSDYRQYLMTDHWQTKKGEAYATWGRECVMCGMPGAQIHHVRDGYKHLFRENVRQHLRPVCRGCHKRHHRK